MAFQSDKSIHGRFKANYSFIELKCGGIVKTSEQIIYPPLDGTTYAHDSFCKWLIVAPEGFSIQLEWLSFDLEVADGCNYDYVMIFDNSSKSDEPIGKYCKSTPPSMHMAGNIATIIFKTDSSGR